LVVKVRPPSVEICTPFEVPAYTVDPLAKTLLAGGIAPGTTMVVGAGSGALTFALRATAES
jgi:hypothetical protein